MKTDFNQTLLIIEKKAKLLFEPFFDRFIEKKFSPAFIRSCHDVVWIKGLLSERVSLLADSINTGAEIMNVVTNMAVTKHTIDKIYCYVLNTEAIKKLKANEFTANIPIITAHTIQAHAGDPQDFIEKLKILYTSMPDPMDIDHAYDIYYGDCSLTPAEFKNIIEDCCKKAMNLDGLSFKKDEKVILPKTVESMRMEIKHPHLISVNSNPKIQPLMKTIRFDYANLKLKTFLRKETCSFRLLAVFQSVICEKRM